MDSDKEYEIINNPPEARTIVSLRTLSKKPVNYSSTSSSSDNSQDLKSDNL
ncbi:hypothetical protein GBAR_LOCUS31835 [Geodia barretti]|uniref:Uncharacterized protein n=1 Tax=Geodia barretti TaxID=519541 RepID=A0AA35U407_GEOBA|nr:hypothetical protein GBAR_LOCUS31835 [Geodia barretti]